MITVGMLVTFICEWSPSHKFYKAKRDGIAVEYSDFTDQIRVEVPCEREEKICVINAPERCLKERSK